MALVIEQITSGSGNWQVPAGINQITVLTVAGGGGGGSMGGGGGAGGYVISVDKSVTPLSLIPYSVGIGGSPGDNATAATNGQNSFFDTDTAIGGGSGGVRLEGLRNGGSGGSGGGGGSSSAGFGVGGSGTVGQGNGGGSGTTSGNFGCGGGGGAGSAGVNATTTTGGNGGSGVYFGDIFGDIYGLSGWFCGGGGGATFNGGTPGIGIHGGANGVTDANGINATANTGGGGGGGGFTLTGGFGGSGVILIAYQTPQDETLNQPSSLGFKVNQQLQKPIAGYGPAVTLFNEAGTITEIALTFDQLGRPLVFYRLSTNDLKVYWFDPVLGANTITVIGQGSSPRAIFDFPTDTSQSFTDAVIFYIGTDTQVKYRKQRDRYQVEYSIPGLFGERIVSAGLTTENRVQVVAR